jgi:hypothetical protein
MQFWSLRFDVPFSFCGLTVFVLVTVFGDLKFRRYKNVFVDGRFLVKIYFVLFGSGVYLLIDINVTIRIKMFHQKVASFYPDLIFKRKISVILPGFVFKRKICSNRIQCLF